MKSMAIIPTKVLTSLQSLFLVFCVVFIHQACAQSVRNINPVKGHQIVPVMKLTNVEANPMHIDELKIDIKVVGQLAVTSMEIRYYNDNDRVMEGEFSFPLAEGMTVSRFALDINGTMREGVVVEKETGRKTFEAIARRRVDPGLLEKTEGNNFKARVFPLPAKGYRTIIIAYEQELADKDNGYLYQLPLNIEDEIGRFSIHAEVFKQQVILDSTENEFNDINFRKWNESYVTDIKKENFKPDKQLAFIVPASEKKLSVYTEPFFEKSDSSWFYINLKPKKVERQKALPDKVALFWDNSNSGKNRDIEKELSVLGGYIQKIGNLQIELVPFNIKTEKSQTFQISNGNWDNLRSALSKLTYDGGTSFGNINFTKYAVREILLFSDGLSSFGKSEPLLSKTPVMVVNSSSVPNHSFLTFIAQQTNGTYINLSRLSVGEAIESLLKSDYRFISAKVISGNVSQIYPSVSAQLNNTFSIAGILKGKSATVALNFGFGNEIVFTETVTVSADEFVKTGILKRLWAQKKLANLSLNEEANKDEITRLGKAYGIVTSNTSLIVLEDINDYLQYRIVPPFDMQKDYFARLNEEKQTSDDQIKNHLNSVTSMLEERKTWWNTTYPLKKMKTNVQDATDTAAVVMDTLMEEVVESAAPAQFILEERTEVAYSSPAPVDENIEEDIEKEENQASIQLNAWDPQSPYLKVLQYATAGEEHSTYMRLKDEYGSLPFFYVDASDFFFKKGQKDIALRIISNLAELKLEEPQLLRILGKKLQLMNQFQDAVLVFEKVLKIKGEEAQSYRDLGLAYEAAGQFQLSIKTMYEAVKKEWDDRFPGIELILLEEINNIIALHKSSVDYSFIDKRLIMNMPVDIRVVLSWDTDNCDMDLWVTDPSGEKCYFENKLTHLGGLISNDYTQGYGPEEFMIKKAITGEYTVQANYYGTNSQSILALVTLHLTFFTNYGKPNQKKQETTLRLEEKEDVITVGKFGFKKM